MSFASDKGSDRRRKSDPRAVSENSPSKQKVGKRGQSPEIGSALRSVYQRTIDEDIPSEMLDLLGKLG